MDGNIDKIDVKAEHQQLIDLYYRLELIHFVEVLLYQDPTEK